VNPRVLDHAFTRIPLLAGAKAADFNVSLMPGYTNQNFRIQDSDRDWVVRIPRDDTNQHIDRAAEAYNQTQASELGIAPLYLWRDSDGLSITPTLTASREVTPADFDNEVIIRKIVNLLQLLHGSDRPFQGTQDLGELIARYYSMLPGARQAQFQQRVERAQHLLDDMKTQDAKVVPSHNDLVLENMLLDKSGLWLIDWEYSAMASPYWDLATICNSARLSATHSRRLLQVYCEAAAPMEESTLFQYRQLLQLLSDCWMAAFVGN
jgi:thiamine kinase-like enzyme